MATPATVAATPMAVLRPGAAGPPSRAEETQHRQRVGRDQRRHHGDRAGGQGGVHRQHRASVGEADGGEPADAALIQQRHHVAFAQPQQDDDHQRRGEVADHGGGHRLGPDHEAELHQRLDRAAGSPQRPAAAAPPRTASARRRRPAGSPARWRRSRSPRCPAPRPRRAPRPASSPRTEPRKAGRGCPRRRSRWARSAGWPRSSAP